MGGWCLEPGRRLRRVGSRRSGGGSCGDARFPAARLLAGQVAAPDVIGLGWDEAIAVLRAVGLVAVGPDADGPPLAAVGWPGGVVVDQRPEPGAMLPVGSPVTVWVKRGPGSSGVREPRRPKPEARSASGMMDEETDEAIG